jgi:uncharacterized membrane protein YhaH (DUF805 family)
MANFCSHCGHPVKPTDRFCGFCGAPLTDSQPAPDATQEKEKPQEEAAGTTSGQEQAKVTPQDQVPLYRPEALHQNGANGGTAPHQEKSQQAPNSQAGQESSYQQSGYQQTPPYGQTESGQVPPYQQEPNGGFSVPPYQPAEGSFFDKAKADFTYKGRLNRKRFWVRSIIAGVISSAFSPLCAAEDSFVALIGLLVCLLAAIYGTLVEIRRCHDLGKSGFYLLFLAVPIYGIYVAIKILFFEGERYSNRFGPDPLLREGLW